jgi:protein SCO1/2
VSIALAAFLVSLSGRAADPTTLPIHDDVGGEFAAQSSLGRVVRLSEFQGKVVFLFFGYTSCQDICPATLAHLRSLTAALGPAADEVQVLLVTIDPENDTPDRLRQYLARFDGRFIGLTGKKDEIDHIAKLFMAEHDRSHGMKVSMEHNRSKAFVKSAYLISHSQQIYLLDKAGRTRAFFFTGSPVSDMKEAVLALQNE